MMAMPPLRLPPPPLLLLYSQFGDYKLITVS